MCLLFIVRIKLPAQLPVSKLFGILNLLKKPRVSSIHKYRWKLFQLYYRIWFFWLKTTNTLTINHIESVNVLRLRWTNMFLFHQETVCVGTLQTASLPVFLLASSHSKRKEEWIKDNVEMNFMYNFQRAETVLVADFLACTPQPAFKLRVHAGQQPNELDERWIRQSCS